MDQVKLSDCTKTRPTAQVLGPHIARKLSPEEQFQRVLQLRQDILSANKGLPTPPIVHGIDLNHLRPKCGVQWVGVYKTMPNLCDNSISALIHHNEVEVVTTPMPITELPHATFTSTTSPKYQAAFHSLLQQSTTPLTLQEIEQIDTLTTGQSSNKEWHRQRRGAITSSKFHIIIHGTPHAQERYLGEIIRGASDFRKVPLSIKWGRCHEELALSTYVKYMMKMHRDVEISQPGLLVHRVKPYLRASPDALVFCSCHGTRLVEVKCPWSTRYLHPERAIEDGKIEYVVKENNTLHPKKRGYFDQIQGLMAITECTSNPGHLVIWSKGGIKVIDVPFDHLYWTAAESKLGEFFKHRVIPGILMPSKKKVDDLDEEVNKLTLDSPDIEKMLTDVDVQIEESDTSVVTCKVEEVPEEVTVSSYSQYKDEVEVHEVNRVTVHCDAKDPLHNVNNSNIKEEEWVLGCESNCIEEKQSKYSSIKGCMIACDVNIKCHSNTWYHMACEGFRRMPAALTDEKSNVTYVCQLCRDHHSQQEELVSTNGFLQQEKEDEEDKIFFLGTSTDGEFRKEVQHHQLAKSDEDVIVNGGWLSDIHINSAQALIKEKHPYIEGLENCVLAETHGFSVPAGEFIQILNSTGQHWVTLTSIGCEIGKVKIYDSSFRGVSKRMKTIIQKLLHIPSKHIQIELPSYQQQPNGDDCGLFAIASAVCLAEGQDPAEENWDVNLMRPHLLQCLKNACIKAFPTNKGPVSRLAYKSYKINNSC